MTNHTDTSRSGDLVKWLRLLDHRLSSSEDLRLEAADRIEALEAENERLREGLQKIADRARALRHGTDDWFELVEFETVVRAALGGKQ